MPISFLINKFGKRIKRFQHIAIDDATRIHALKAYTKNIQANAMKFQSKFYWHMKNCKIIHHYINQQTHI